MAQVTFPFTTTPVSFYLVGYPFRDTSEDGYINGSQWDECKLTLESFNNNVLTGKLYFECTTRRQGVSMSAYSIGTTYGPNDNYYHVSVKYSVNFICYDNNGNIISTVTPSTCDNHIIYQVPSAIQNDGYMWNWATSSRKTCEPWVVRYASDKAGNLYQRVPDYDYSYSNPAHFRYNMLYPSKPGSYMRSWYENGGWQTFSVTLPNGTASFAVDLVIYTRNGTTNNQYINTTKRLYGSGGVDPDPVVVDTASKVQLKPYNANAFNNTGRVWYKAAGSTTWEKKYLYKKGKNSTSWTKL